MPNVIEQRGFFSWLDGLSTHGNPKGAAVPGLLSISAEGHIKLDLDGALPFADAPKVARWGESTPLPSGTYITGRLRSEPDGELILLDGLKRTDFGIDDVMTRPQSYEARTCLIAESHQDKAFSAGFSLENFHQLRIGLVGLEEWLNLGSLQVGIEDRIDDDVEVRVKYRNQKFSYDIPGGNILIDSLTTGASLWGFGDSYPQYPQEKVTFEQTNWLTWTPASESSFDAFRYNFTRIEEVLALLLGSYYQLDWPTFIKRHNDEEFWYKVYFFRGSVPEFKPSRYFFWASFNDLRDSFGGLFAAWKEQVERYGAGYYLYLAALQNPLPYSEHRFVNLIWALESLHKRQNPCKVKTPLADRIFDSLSKLPVRFDKDALREFSRRCAKRRNQISHEGGPPEKEDYDDFSKDLWNLTEALSYLYHAYLLNGIGLDEGILRSNLTQGGLAEMRIAPALNRVGLNLSKTTQL